jgi:hypothetical protein
VKVITAMVKRTILGRAGGIMIKLEKKCKAHIKMEI